MGQDVCFDLNLAVSHRLPQASVRDENTGPLYRKDRGEVSGQQESAGFIAGAQDLQVGSSRGWDYNPGTALPFPLVRRDLPSTLLGLAWKHRWLCPQRRKNSKVPINVHLALREISPFLPFADLSHWFIHSSDSSMAILMLSKEGYKEGCKENINSVQQTRIDPLPCTEQHAKDRVPPE